MSGLGCQWPGMLKEQISGLLGDKILDQSFQNGNFSPKPNLTQEYLTSTRRSPLRESHVANISQYYKFPQKIQLLQIKLIGLNTGTYIPFLANEGPIIWKVFKFKDVSFPDHFFFYWSQLIVSPLLANPPSSYIIITDVKTIRWTEKHKMVSFHKR